MHNDNFNQLENPQLKTSLSGLFQEGDTGRGHNVFSSGMGCPDKSQPSDYAPNMAGITDGLSDLWNKAKDMASEGIESMWGANVDSYTAEKQAESARRVREIEAANRVTAGGVTPTYITVPTTGAGIMETIQKNPMVTAGLAFMAFQFFKK